jgi:hypothetical protein
MKQLFRRKKKHNSPSQNRDEKHSHSTQARIRFTPRDDYGSEERTWPDEGRAWRPPLSVDRSYRRLEEKDRKRVDVSQGGGGTGIKLDILEE